VKNRQAQPFIGINLQDAFGTARTRDIGMPHDLSVGLRKHKASCRREDGDSVANMHKVVRIERVHLVDHTKRHRDSPE